MHKFRLALPTAALLMASTAAQAHIGAGNTDGIIQGLAHPFSGVDHILAMVAVGLFAAHLGGRALWLVPLSFISMMVIGGAFATAGVDLPFAEVGISFSVLVLGIGVAVGLSVPTAAAMAMVGLLAIFHGHAHGAEMPESLSRFEYGLGFVLATATLHTLGIGVSLSVGEMPQSYKNRTLQITGSAIALAGVALLTGYL